METQSGQRNTRNKPEEAGATLTHTNKMASGSDTSIEKLSAILPKLETSIQTMDESIKTLTTDATTNTESIKKLNIDLTKRMDDMIANDTNNTQNIRTHESKIQMLTADV